jgi:hypothetical protein
MKIESPIDFLFKEIYGETGYFDAYTVEGKSAYDAYREAKLIEDKAISEAFAAGQKNGYEYAKQKDVLLHPFDYYKNKYQQHL